MPSVPMIPLNDVFGPTIQGEGPYMGHVVNFIRLGLCNLHCTRCDTKQTWDKDNYDLKKENPLTTADDIFGRMHRLVSNTNIVVISGGEPLMHQDNGAFRALLRLLVNHAYDVHIETNGTRKPRPEIANLVAHFSVSPKVTSALTSPKDDKSKRIKPEVLQTFADYVRMGKACFKFVCESSEDVDAAWDLAASLGMLQDEVWIMPAGETPDETNESTKIVLFRTLELGLNFTPRLHILTGVK